MPASVRVQVHFPNKSAGVVRLRQPTALKVINIQRSYGDGPGDWGRQVHGRW
jgi:hypothetical protein